MFQPIAVDCVADVVVVGDVVICGVVVGDVAVVIDGSSRLCWQQCLRLLPLI